MFRAELGHLWARGAVVSDGMNDKEKDKQDYMGTRPGAGIFLYVGAALWTQSNQDRQWELGGFAGCRQA